jgi:hypothetical protein
MFDLMFYDKVTKVFITVTREVFGNTMETPRSADSYHLVNSISDTKHICIICCNFNLPSTHLNIYRTPNQKS